MKLSGHKAQDTNKQTLNATDKKKDTLTQCTSSISKSNRDKRKNTVVHQHGHLGYQYTLESAQLPIDYSTHTDRHREIPSCTYFSRYISKPGGFGLTARRKLRYLDQKDQMACTALAMP